MANGRPSLAPDYWKLTYVKSMEHEAEIAGMFRGMFAFNWQKWDFKLGNEVIGNNGNYSAWFQNYAGGYGAADFMNWKDNCQENAPPVAIFNNDWWLSQNFLPGFQETSLFPNGVADAKRIRDWAAAADYYAMVLRQYEWRWANYGGPKGEYRAEWNPKGQNCVDKIYENIYEIFKYSRNLRNNDNNNPFRWPVESGASYSNSPYEKMFVDRANWYSNSNDGNQLEEYRKKMLASFSARPGFISTEEFLGTFFKVFGAIGTVATIIGKVGLVVAATVTGGAIATAVAPSIGGAIGVSTEVAAGAVKAGVVGAVTGGNPISVINPVLGEVGKNLTPVLSDVGKTIIGDTKVGFFEDISSGATDLISQVKNQSIGKTVGDVIGKVGGISVGGIVSEATQTLLKSSPTDVIAGLSKTVPAPVVATPVTVSTVAAKAAIPVGALAALGLVIYFSMRK